MMRSIASRGTGLLAMAALIGGCSTMSQRLNGAYEGKLGLHFAPGTDPFVAGTLDTFKLVVRPNGYVTLSDRSVPVDGSITYGARVATFTPERIAGRPVGENSDQAKQYLATLTPSADGTWLYQSKVETVRLKPSPNGSP